MLTLSVYPNASLRVISKMLFYLEMWPDVPPYFHFPLSFQVLIIRFIMIIRPDNTEQSNIMIAASQRQWFFERVVSSMPEIRSMINTIVRYAHVLIYDIKYISKYILSCTSSGYMMIYLNLLISFLLLVILFMLWKSQKGCSSVKMILNHKPVKEFIFCNNQESTGFLLWEPERCVLLG